MTDSQMASLWERISDQRRNRMRHNAERLLATGHVRPDMSVEQVRDVLYAFSAPELYEILVLQRGWSPSQYGDSCIAACAAS